MVRDDDVCCQMKFLLSLSFSLTHVFQSIQCFDHRVKRQRYQKKLKEQGKRSTLSDDREKVLDEAGMVWDSHAECWTERLQELIEYRRENGDCNVPSRYKENRQLAIWVKRQRRQYKFFMDKQPSSMTQERIETLEALGFIWDLRAKNK
jgi:hypothetical protein